MAVKSLQDQLLKAGLVDKKKANKLKAEKLQKKQKIKTGKAVAEDDSAHQEALKKQREAKLEKDKALNKAKQDAMQLKAVQAQIRQMIEMNRLTHKEGDVAYNFKDEKKVKKIYVNEDIHKDLSVGRLAIVKLEQAYEIVPEQVAAKIAQRDESFILVCNDRKEEELDEDDPYADFKIPDDLMW
jgi:uncharacterized protein YaiL (DUF2058 family)